MCWSLVLLCIGCYSYSMDNFDFEKESNKIVSQFLKEMQAKEKIYCSGLGGGSRGEINTISIYWDSSKKVKKNEARRMIIFVTEELLKRFNSNKTIRPYLHNYPFGIENVDLHIGFNKDYKDPEQVEYVSLGKNKIYYYNFEEEMLCDPQGESFEEALTVYRTQFIMKEKK